MKLILGELQKVFRNRAALWVILGTLLVNGIFALFSIKNENYYSEKAYRSIHKDLSQKTYDEALATVDERLRLSEFAFSILAGFSQETLMAQFGEQYPVLAERYGSGAYPLYNDNAYSEREMLYLIKSEYDAAGHYGEYLAKIQDSAKKMELLAKRYDTNGFLYQNVIKTAQDLKKNIKVIEKIGGPSRGIERAFNSTFTDILGVFVLFSAVMLLLIRERETQQLLLIRTTDMGRMPLGASKVLTSAVIAILTVALLYAENLIIYGMLYGLGDLTRPIYTIFSYQSCKYTISLYGYIGLFILGKCVVYIGVVLFLMLGAILCKNAITLFAFGMGAFGAEMFLYKVLPNRGIGVLLKNINVVAFLNTDVLLKDYRNLNVFNTPVNYQSLFWYFGILVLIGEISLCIVLFAYMGSYTGIKLRRIKLFGKFSFGNKGNLFLQECYKIFIRGRVLLFLTVYIAGIMYFYKPIRHNFFDEADAYYYYYMHHLEGTYTSEKEAWIAEEENRIQEERISVLDAPFDISFEIRMQSLDKKDKALRQVKERAEYLGKREGTAFVYETGYQLIYDDAFAKGKSWELALRLTCMMLISLAYVYGVEYETGMIVPIRTCCYGRGYTVCCKVGISWIISTILYVVTYGSYYYNVFQCYGTQSIFEKASSIPALQNYSCSILTYLILVCILRYIAMLITMAVVLLLSVKAKKLSVTIAVGTALLAVPLLMGMLSIRGSEYILLNPLWLAKMW